MLTSILADAASTQPAVAASMSWAEAVGIIISTVLTLAIIPAIKQYRASLDAQRQASEALRTETTVDTTRVIVNRLQDYLIGSASAIAEREFVNLARRVVSGEVKTPEEVKAELRLWGVLLKSRAVEYFQHQGVDLRELIGDDAVDRLVERAANAVSPFPGMETSSALLSGRSAEALAAYGVLWVRQAWVDDPERVKAGAPKNPVVSSAT